MTSIDSIVSLVNLAKLYLTFIHNSNNIDKHIDNNNKININNDNSLSKTSKTNNNNTILINNFTTIRQRNNKSIMICNQLQCQQHQNLANVHSMNKNEAFAIIATLSPLLVTCGANKSINCTQLSSVDNKNIYA